MADGEVRGYRDAVTGRWARRPVPNVDAESRFGPMADSIEDIKNVSADDVRPGMERPRYAPVADTLAGEGPTYGSSPLGHRTARLVPPGDGTTAIYAAPRPETRLRDIKTGADGRALPEALRYLLGSLDGSDSGPQPRGLSTTVYGDGGPTLSPTRAEDVAPGRGRRH
jgi:hypothetical protein